MSQQAWIDFLQRHQKAPLSAVLMPTRAHDYLRSLLNQLIEQRGREITSASAVVHNQGTK